MPYCVYISRKLLKRWDLSHFSHLIKWNTFSMFKLVILTFLYNIWKLTYVLYKLQKFVFFFMETTCVPSFVNPRWWHKITCCWFDIRLPNRYITISWWNSKMNGFIVCCVENIILLFEKYKFHWNWPLNNSQ